MNCFGAQFARLAIFLLMVASVARAHEARPCYLELKETSPGQFEVLWRTPVLAGMRVPVALRLPADIKDLKDPKNKNSLTLTSSDTGLTPDRTGWPESASSSPDYS